LVNAVQLYLDDSGTRNPDRKPGKRAAHGHDWFSLGGILVAEDADIKDARRRHEEFCYDWKITAPLHSSEIRGKHKNFNFLRSLSKAQQQEFYEGLYQLMVQSPITGIACVIDRPGYNARYRERYGRQRWSLCKTAFAICVERAAKFARNQNAKLRVYVERADRKTDEKIREYYDALRDTGMPFGRPTSDKYSPLNAAELRETLYEFRTKAKTSPMIQMADLFLWPMCIGGYDGNNRPYKRLIEDGKLIDCSLNKEEQPFLGIKYSCFD